MTLAPSAHARETGTGDGDASALGECTAFGLDKGMQAVSPKDITVQAAPKAKRDRDLRRMMCLGFDEDLMGSPLLVYTSL